MSFDSSGRVPGYHKTNSKFAPENRPLEKEIPNLETTIFRCELAVSFREGILIETNSKSPLKLQKRLTHGGRLVSPGVPAFFHMLVQGWHPPQRKAEYRFPF